MSGAPASPFPADALAANQAGKLTDSQRSLYAGNDRSSRRSELYVAIGAIIIALLLVTSTGPAPNAAFRPLFALICVVVAAVLVFRATLAPDALSSDLSKGAVESAEGAILKRVVQSSGGRSGTSTHYIDVAGNHFRVGPQFYQGAPDAGYVKVYYLPRSKTLVNLEQLPDRPLPAGALDGSGTIVQATLAGLTSHDENAQAEALAQMAVLRKGFQAGVVPGTVEAPADEHDQPPLAGAILGTWRAGPISVTFAADGTMTTDLPGGRGQPGRWSIDASGELHAQFAGRDTAGEAWVSGTTLTIKADGEARQFQRVSS
jgi:hypothetical protein